MTIEMIKKLLAQGMSEKDILNSMTAELRKASEDYNKEKKAEQILRDEERKLDILRVEMLHKFAQYGLAAGILDEEPSEEEISKLSKELKSIEKDIKAKIDKNGFEWGWKINPWGERIEDLWNDAMKGLFRF